jgi:hypothetical protein
MNLSNGRLDAFLTKTNTAYDKMYELVGGAKPFNGAKMQLQSTRDMDINYEGMSGQPILWNTTGLYFGSPSNALRMNQLNADVTEIPLHELGHNFDSYTWEFEPEALAIFKIYYYFDKTNEKMAVANQSQSFTGGSGFKTYMKSYANRLVGEINYDAAMSQGVYSPYSLAYTLAKIYEAVGEQAFKDTFAYFHSLGGGNVPTTNIGKFNLFLSKLKDFSGVDVFGSTYFTTQEKNIYQAKLGGTIQYVYSPLTDAEVYVIAEYYVQEHFGASYSVYNLKVPLYDENGIRIAFSVPFKNGSSSWVGHVIVGASAANLSFYLIDPDTSSYDSIVAYNNTGYKVMFEAPLYYFVNTQNPGLTGMSAMNSTFEGLSTNDSEALSITSEIARNTGYLTASEMDEVENDVLFSEENRLQKLALLKDLSQEYEGIGSYQGNSYATTFSTASTEAYALVPERATGDQSYVRVKVSANSADTYYGGNQGWLRTYGSTRNGILDGNDMADTACGAVAFSDLVAYSVFKNISAYGDLLQYTNEPKRLYMQNGIIAAPNPDFNLSNFDQTFAYNGSSRSTYWFTKAEYTKFIDFYADMGEIPSILGIGTSIIGLENAFDELSDITGHDYIKSVPAGRLMADLDGFLKTQLAADVPVLMLNSSEYDSNLEEYINGKTNNHWMTITKYFINNSSNPAYAGSFVALATWGGRYSVNTDLLRQTDMSDWFYSDFFSYEILP